MLTLYQGRLKISGMVCLRVENKYICAIFCCTINISLFFADNFVLVNIKRTEFQSDLKDALSTGTLKNFKNLHVRCVQLLFQKSYQRFHDPRRWFCQCKSCLKSVCHLTNLNHLHFSKNDGSGLMSIYGGAFVDENFALKHTGPGLLSMVNKNKKNEDFLVADILINWKLVRRQIVVKIQTAVSSLSHVPNATFLTANMSSLVRSLKECLWWERSRTCQQVLITSPKYQYLLTSFNRILYWSFDIIG